MTTQPTPDIHTAAAPQQPPTPPAQPDYHPSYGPLTASRAMGYGWDTVKANLSSWLSITLIGFVLYTIGVLLVWWFQPVELFTVTILLVIWSVMALLFQACLLRGAMDELDGNRPTPGAFLENLRSGRVLVTAVLMTLSAAAGFLLCIVPGLVVVFGSMYALHFVVDRNENPFQALLSSWRLVAANIAVLGLLALSIAVAILLGALLCGLGLLVALPVAAVATGYAYRTLTYGTVSTPWV